VRPEGLGKFKISPHGVSNPQPSDWQPNDVYGVAKRTVKEVVVISFNTICIRSVKLVTAALGIRRGDSRNANATHYPLR
jgi:hypothetical protein